MQKQVVRSLLLSYQKKACLAPVSQCFLWYKTDYIIQSVNKYNRVQVLSWCHDKTGMEITGCPPVQAKIVPDR